MNYAKIKFLLLTLCSSLCFVTQSSHGAEQKNHNTNSAVQVTWSQHIRNQWDAIKKDNRDHYNRIGQAHAHAGLPTNTREKADKNS
jgi:hypothetical protein